MDLQSIITLFFGYMMVAIVLSTISKFVCDGIIAAWSIQNGWLKRFVVLAMNVLLTYYVCLILNSYAYIEAAMVLLFVISGADALHNALNKIKEYTVVTNTQTSIPEVTEYSED